MQDSQFQFVWFYVNDQKQPLGPYSQRDLDVMYKTALINSSTLVWKEGMPEWKQYFQVKELFEDQNENDRIQDLYEKEKINIQADTQPKKQQKIQQKLQEKYEKMLDKQIQDDEFQKLHEENPTDAYEQAANKLLENYIYQKEDKWFIFNQEKQEWQSQEEKPEEQIKQTTQMIKDQLQQKTQSLTAEDIRKIKRKKAKQKRQNEKKKEKWYNSKYNTYIYISGLPKTITIEQIDEFFSRAGVIRKDLQTQEKKIKLYKDEQGNLKGDAAISYAMIESVDLAITMLDEREIEPGYSVKVEKAQFSQHGEEYKKRQVEKTNNNGNDKVKKLQTQAEIKQLLGWEDEDQIDSGLKIVTIKNLFDLKEEKTDEFFEELQNDVIQEIQRSIGPVQRFKIFDTNPEGVVQIKFKSSQMAQKCIELMNGRYFDQKQLLCEYWDGVTDYKRIRNDKDDEEKRLNDFGKWIEEKNKQQI